MSNFAFICPYQLLTLKRKVTFRQLFSRPGPCDLYELRTQNQAAPRVFQRSALGVGVSIRFQRCLMKVFQGSFLWHFYGLTTNHLELGFVLVGWLVGQSQQNGKTSK